MFRSLSVVVKLGGALSFLTALLLLSSGQQWTVLDKLSGDQGRLVVRILGGTVQISEVQKLVVDFERLLGYHVVLSTSAFLLASRARWRTPRPG